MFHYDVACRFTSLSFLYRRNDVEAYSMVTNSLPKEVVQKSTDEKELQNEMEKPNPKFTKCHFQIAEGKFMKKNTGSFVKKYDDERNLVTPTLQNKIKLITRKIEMFPVNWIYLLWAKLKKRVQIQKGEKEKKFINLVDVKHEK